MRMNENTNRGCLKSRSVIADLFRDLDFVVLNEIPAQGRNDIPILIWLLRQPPDSLNTGAAGVFNNSISIALKGRNTFSDKE